MLVEFCPDLEALAQGRERCRSYLNQIGVGSFFWIHTKENGKCELSPLPYSGILGALFPYILRIEM